ncbi:Uu.00g078050.m01.CDS01 [Anthostomella pinea]|uniref:Uu.00g078050.m01.CDS01 n=1 Tax=Anthostomella pinea TaxID=933095 RepID=A0AAI8VKI9_9PEZI|nr:Uu.00g078050.m01.CDS01 [Anthostomella pinea]
MPTSLTMANSSNMPNSAFGNLARVPGPNASPETTCAWLIDYFEYMSLPADRVDWLGWTADNLHTMDVQEASQALQKCGVEASMAFVSAAQMLGLIKNYSEEATAKEPTEPAAGWSAWLMARLHDVPALAVFGVLGAVAAVVLVSGVGSGGGGGDGVPMMSQHCNNASAVGNSTAWSPGNSLSAYKSNNLSAVMNWNFS